MPPNTRCNPLVRVAATLFVILVGCASPGPVPSLPQALESGAFWSLIRDLSEPPGVFTHSDNLVSNEGRFAETVRVLRPRGGIYIGVGPEQNFSYIARLAPDMAFVVDIREENRDLHLLYKALFELAVDRVEFVARLFSRARPADVAPDAPARTIFAAIDSQPAVERVRRDTGDAVIARLVTHHQLPLLPHNLAAIAQMLDAFMTDGPSITYARGRAGAAPRPTYRALMLAADFNGNPRSYLASTSTYDAIRTLHQRNLIVPVVGDFGRAEALRRIGAYARDHGAAITAFYGSNVDIYLTRAQRHTFCSVFATLPFADDAWFLDGRGRRPIEREIEACRASKP